MQEVEDFIRETYQDQDDPELGFKAKIPYPTAWHANGYQKGFLSHKRSKENKSDFRNNKRLRDLKRGPGERGSVDLSSHCAQLQLINQNSNRMTNMSTQVEKMSHDGLENFLARDNKQSTAFQKRSSSDSQNAILFQSTLSDPRKVSQRAMKNDSARMSLLNNMYSGQKLRQAKMSVIMNQQMHFRPQKEQNFGNVEGKRPKTQQKSFMPHLGENEFLNESSLPQSTKRLSQVHDNISDQVNKEFEKMNKSTNNLAALRRSRPQVEMYAQLSKLEGLQTQNYEKQLFTSTRKLLSRQMQPQFADSGSQNQQPHDRKISVSFSMLSPQPSVWPMTPPSGLNILQTKSPIWSPSSSQENHIRIGSQQQSPVNALANKNRRSYQNDIQGLKHLLKKKQQLKRDIQSRELGKRQHRTQMSRVMVNSRDEQRTKSRSVFQNTCQDDDENQNQLNDILNALESSSFRSAKSDIKAVPVKISSVARDENQLRNALIKNLGSYSFSVLQQKYDDGKLQAKKKEERLKELRAELALAKTENLEEIDPLAISRFHELVGNQNLANEGKPAIQILEDQKLEAIKAFQSDSIMDGSPKRASGLAPSRELSHNSQRSSVLELAQQNQNDRPNIFTEPPSTRQVQNHKLALKLNELKNQLQLRENQTQEQKYQTDIIKAQGTKLQQDIIAHKLMIEKIKPQHQYYENASKKYQRLQILNNARGGVRSNLMHQKRNEAEALLSVHEQRLSKQVEILSRKSGIHSLERLPTSEESVMKKRTPSARILELKLEISQSKQRVQQTHIEEQQVWDDMSSQMKRIQQIREIQIVQELQNTMKGLIPISEVFQKLKQEEDIQQKLKDDEKNLKQKEEEVSEQPTHLVAPVAAGRRTGSGQNSRRSSGSGRATGRSPQLIILKPTKQLTFNAKTENREKPPPKSLNAENQETLNQFRKIAQEIMKKITQLNQFIPKDTEENQTMRYTSRTNSQQPEAKHNCILQKNSEQKLIEFQEQNSNIVPVKQKLLEQMKQNLARNGKEEFVDFEFVGGRLTEMHLLKASLATLQLEQSYEAQGKQKVIMGLMKVLERLKADHQVLYGQEKALEPTIVEQSPDKLKQIKDSSTFIDKQFSNNEEQIKVIQDDCASNAEFCFAVYATINQKIRRSMLVLSELMNLFKNKHIFDPESGVFSERLLKDYNAFLSAIGKSKIKKTSPEVVVEAVVKQHVLFGRQQTIQARKAQKLHNEESSKLAEPSAGISESDFTSSASRSVSGAHRHKNKHISSRSIKTYKNMLEQDQLPEQGSDKILGHLDVDSRFELLKDLFGSLKYLSTDVSHHKNLSNALELLDKSTLMHIIRGNTRLSSVLRLASTTIHQQIFEEEKRQQQYIAAKRKQVAKGLGTKDLSYVPPKPHPSDDYWNPETNAIDDALLCADKLKDDFRKNQKKLAKAQERKVEQMSPQQKESEFLNHFRRDLAKLTQFERDEGKFAIQYRNNVDKMYNRLRNKGSFDDQQQIDTQKLRKSQRKSLERTFSIDMPVMQMRQSSNHDHHLSHKKRAGLTNPTNPINLQAMAKKFHKATNSFADDRFANALLESRGNSPSKTGKFQKGTNQNTSKGDTLIKTVGIDTDKHKHTHKAPTLRNTPQGTLHHAGSITPAHLESVQKAVPPAEKLTNAKVVEALLSRYPQLRRDMLADDTEGSCSDSSVAGVAPSILCSSRNPHLEQSARRGVISELGSGGSVSRRSGNSKLSPSRGIGSGQSKQKNLI